MKNIMIVLLLVGSILGQDKIITNSGQEFPGSYEGETDEVIYFIQEGLTDVVSVPKTRISKVILEDGTVVFDQGAMQKPTQFDQPQTSATSSYLPACALRSGAC